MLPSPHLAACSQVGKLNLVDLAGSERVHVTGATGKRLEESKKINQVRLGGWVGASNCRQCGLLARCSQAWLVCRHRLSSENRLTRMLPRCAPHLQRACRRWAT